MDVFKTKPGISESILINEENFTGKTKKREPYYVTKGDGKISCRAICPICDNPIQIIGLYKKEEECTVKPYGRHHKGYVKRLARYDQTSYENCPYSNPNYRNGNARRTPADPTGQALYRIMRDEFDKIIYILGNTIGIHISIGFAEKLLQSWKVNEGWRYYESTYANLPYMLLYAEPAYSMFGRILPRKGNIYPKLIQCGRNFAFEDHGESYVKIAQKHGKYLDATFYLGNHRYTQDGEHLTETYNLVIVEGKEAIYEKEIEVEEEYLDKLKFSWKDSERNKKLRDLAQTVL